VNKRNGTLINVDVNHAANPMRAAQARSGTVQNAAANADGATRSTEYICGSAKTAIPAFARADTRNATG